MEINITLLIQAVNFIIAFWLLKILYVSQLKPVFEARAAKIAQDLADAESARLDAENRKTEYETKIQEARKESASLIQQAVQQGEQMKSVLVTQGKEEAKILLTKAREETKMEKSRLYEDVKGHVGELAVAMASKLLQEGVDAPTHQKLVEDFVRKVGN